MSSQTVKPRGAWHKRLTPYRVSQVSFLLALAAPPAAAAVLAALRSHITNAALALVMVGVVVLLVIPGRRLAALVAGISAGVWFDFFLTRPYESFSINRSADVQTTVLLVLVAVVVGELAARERHHKSEEAISMEGLAAVQDVAQILAEGNVAEDVVEAVSDALVPLLHLKSCQFDPGQGTVKVPFIDRPGYVTYTAYEWDTTTKGLPVGTVALPARFHDHILGQFLLETPFPGAPISPQVLATAVVLADLAGVALARLDRQRPRGSFATNVTQS